MVVYLSLLYAYSVRLRVVRSFLVRKILNYYFMQMR